jgi:hypothetical protein
MMIVEMAAIGAAPVGARAQSTGHPSSDDGRRALGEECVLDGQLMATARTAPLVMP